MLSRKLSYMRMQSIKKMNVEHHFEKHHLVKYLSSRRTYAYEIRVYFSLCRVGTLVYVVSIIYIYLYIGGLYLYI